MRAPRRCAPRRSAADRRGPRPHRASPCSSTARPTSGWPPSVADLGVDIVAVPVYRWELPEDRGLARRVLQGVVDGSIDAVTFTAAHAVTNFFTIADEIGVTDEVLAAFTGSTYARAMLRRRSLEPPVDAAAIVAPADRAADAWRQLVTTSMLRRGGNQLLVMDGPGRHAGIAAVWPLSQVLAAALDLERLDPGRHRLGAHRRPGPHRRALPAGRRLRPLPGRR